jgi:hypothetical protein
MLPLFVVVSSARTITVDPSNLWNFAELVEPGRTK